MKLYRNDWFVLSGIIIGWIINGCIVFLGKEITLFDKIIIGIYMFFVGKILFLTQHYHLLSLKKEEELSK